MCYSLWYNAPTMLPAFGRPHRGVLHYTPNCNTQSSAPDEGQNNCPKHVELTGIINSVASSCLSILFIFYYIFLRLAKQFQFNSYPENVENTVSS